MKPIAAPIVGGMITSTIHVLILVPVFFANDQGPRHPAWTGPRQRFERSGK
jgi:Cu/Ag efflux pump CusA